MASKNEPERNQDVLLEFLDVLVHLVLYKRNVYTESAFDRKTAYGSLRVHQAKDPEVCGFVARHLESLRTMMPGVRRFELVIVDERDAPLEVHAVTFSALAAFWQGEPFDSRRLQVQFRNALLHLDSKMSDLKPLGVNDETSFVFRAQAEQETMEDANWCHLDSPRPSSDGFLVPVYGLKEACLDLKLSIETMR